MVRWKSIPRDELRPQGTSQRSHARVKSSMMQALSRRLRLARKKSQKVSAVEEPRIPDSSTEDKNGPSSREPSMTGLVEEPLKVEAQKEAATEDIEAMGCKTEETVVALSVANKQSYDNAAEAIQYLQLFADRRIDVTPFVGDETGRRGVLSKEEADVLESLGKRMFQTMPLTPQDGVESTKRLANILSSYSSEEASTVLKAMAKLKAVGSMHGVSSPVGNDHQNRSEVSKITAEKPPLAPSHAPRQVHHKRHHTIDSIPSGRLNGGSKHQGIDSQPRSIGRSKGENRSHQHHPFDYPVKDQIQVDKVRIPGLYFHSYAPRRPYDLQ